MTDQPPTVDRQRPSPGPRRRWLVWVGMLLAVPALVLVVALVCLQIWKSGWQSEVDRQLAELRAAGVPTTPADLEAAYRLPEGTEDCTQCWLDATAPLVEAADELKASGLPFLDNSARELPPPGQDWPQLAEAEALLARFQPCSTFPVRQGSSCRAALDSCERRQAALPSGRPAVCCVLRGPAIGDWSRQSRR